MVEEKNIIQEHYPNSCDVLCVKDLNLWFGEKHVLKNINFCIEKGEVLCVVGESGSGKTSILYSLLGLFQWGARLEGS
ncbi:MAG: ATP-binding cassette domain-containing protein, partial [candidate division WOR-3 bacterium]|nr:ATP-binding cassette domain-containing protein [candidate division WOR-3 bacterium]